ncbi:MAG: DNA gyrase subunit A [Xanthomonadales bacterium]|nr:DNA gyrase subunit A [Xanthomonadales bacterium]
MADLAKEILRVNIEDEMRQSYLDYAMSVIVGRALPDVRDGLKPVHRRVLYAMKELGNDHNKPYKKSARVVGDVIGKYHPHGDTAVYDTMVRMAQPFSLRYMLIDGQGNFGSVDGDPPAAMRYTEVRLTRLAHALMRDIDKDTVDFQPNYDDKELEPTVMPTVVPNLLINGSSGIAVGMATNIPPHNLTEVINALIALIAEPDLSIEDLMQHISGPDFPTAGIINGSYGIREAYRTGRGRILVRGKADIETEGNREAIIITELPYQVNKARLIEKIAELAKAKEIEGIAPDGLRDESDKDGMRVVIEVKRGENAEVLLNKLYKQTQLETVFGINVVALVGGQPKTLNLKEILDAFLRHRREVVTRRTIFDLRKARSRAHVLEGLTVALANIDEMIELIKSSKDAHEARERMLAKRWEPGLVRALLASAGADRSRPEDLSPEEGLFEDGYQLSEIQAKEILEMRLQRLTGLEQEKLTDEYRTILAAITELFRILEEPGRLMEVIQEELVAIRDEFGDERRTRIEHSQSDLDILDLIPPEDVVVTLSHSGYIKRQPLTVYRSQRRGGRGKSATALKDEDFIERLWIANTHDTLLAFTGHGRVFKLPVYQVPEASAGSRGRPIVNMLPLEAGEKIQAVLPIHEFADNLYVFFATRQGVCKKTTLSDFANVRANGIRAVELDDGDGLVSVALTDGSRDIMLFGSHGKAVRFSEDEVRSMGRTARGVRGMRFGESAGEDARVVAMIMVDGDGDILTATARGYGKRTAVAEFPTKGRGTQGVIAIQTSERNGELVGAIQLTDAHDVMLISDQGTLVRTRASEISQVGRNTQGVTLIRLPEDETLVGLERLDALAEDDEDQVDTGTAGDSGATNAAPDAPPGSDPEAPPSA